LLEVIEGFFEESLLDGMSVLHSSGGFCHGIDDSFEHCGVEVLPLGDISCRPRGQGTSSYLSQEAELQMVWPQYPLYFLVSEDGVHFSKNLCSFFS